MANDLNDSVLQQTGRRQVANIDAKSENQSAAWNIAGRATSAGITAAKEDGPFLKNFKTEFFSPYNKYDQVMRALKGQPNAAPIPGQAPPDNGNSPMSSINGDNAEFSGAVINHWLLPTSSGST